MEFVSSSIYDTEKLAKKLAKKYKKGAVILFQGPLGSGKTTFIQTFAKALGVTGRIISPTFILMKPYDLPKSLRKLYHLDLYRLENQQQIESLGLEEIWNNPQNIVLIEWAAKLAQLPPNYILISIEILGPKKRIFKVKEEQTGAA